MAKLVVLKVNSDFKHQIFCVPLKNGSDLDCLDIKVSGNLPLEANLANYLNHWLNKYQFVAILNCIKHKQNTVNNSINQRILYFWQTVKVLKYSRYLQEFCSINNTLCKDSKCNDTVRVLNSTDNNPIQSYRS